MFILTGAGSIIASVAAACACQACTCVTKEVLRKSARLAYCVLFFLAMVLAWVLRDFAKPIIEKLPWIIHQSGVGDRWYGQQAVYRVSLGNTLFFGLMSAVLIGVKYKSDKRDQYLHHGGWLVKLGLWLLCNALPFFLPVSVINAYGWVARFGSGLFLIVQMIILLDLTQAWNDRWVAMEDERFLYALLAITVGCYTGACVLVGLLFYFFKPSGFDCNLNVALICLTVLVCLGFTALSLLPQARNGSLFPAGMITLYCTYLAYSALQSEPYEYECNGLRHNLTAASGSTLAIGMCITMVSVVYSALRAGSNTTTFRLTGAAHDDEHEAAGKPLIPAGGGDAEEGTSAGLDGAPAGVTMSKSEGKRDEKAIDEFEPVTYNYSFFHLIFALASMYIAMLMTGWGTGAEERDLIDVGWTSVWVKIVAQWLTAGLYAWTLAAPMLFPDRDFS